MMLILGPIQAVGSWFNERVIVVASGGGAAIHIVTVE